MRRLFAPLAVVALLLSSAAESAEGSTVGQLLDINSAKGLIKIDNAEYTLGNYSLNGLQIGDRVRVVFTQEDEHDLPAIRTITMLER